MVAKEKVREDYGEAALRLQAEVRRSMELRVGCVAGALEEYEHVGKSAKAGFNGVKPTPEGALCPGVL